MFADTVSEAEAARVAGRNAEALVIGAAEMLVCEDRWYDKPATMDAARGHVQALRGKQHALVSAICVMRNDTRIWYHREYARLTMRPLSDAFLDDYLAASGPEVLESVGAYRLEGLGIQLFSKIEGEYTSVRGLPRHRSERSRRCPRRGGPRRSRARAERSGRGWRTAPAGRGTRGWRAAAGSAPASRH